MKTLLVLSFQSGITLVFFGIMFLFVAAWVVVQLGRGKQLNDAVHLEFLIENSLINHVNFKNIQALIIEYRSRDIDSELLAKLDKKFRTKFSKFVKEEDKKRIAS